MDYMRAPLSWKSALLLLKQSALMLMAIIVVLTVSFAIRERLVRSASLRQIDDLAGLILTRVERACDQ
jgi:hypothetical protein